MSCLNRCKLLIGVYQSFFSSEKKIHNTYSCNLNECSYIIFWTHLHNIDWCFETCLIFTICLIHFLITTICIIIYKEQQSTVINILSAYWNKNLYMCMLSTFICSLFSETCGPLWRDIIIRLICWHVNFEKNNLYSLLLILTKNTKKIVKHWKD